MNSNEGNVSIPLALVPGGSRLYRSYIKGMAAAEELFQHRPFELNSYVEQANAVNRRKYHRHELATALRAQNEALSADSRALENCDRLADPSCLAVLTGQQVGLLTGPSYTIIKALHTAKLAEKLEQELGQPVVPIFWMELEDHDLDEVNNFSFKTKKQQLKKLCVAKDGYENKTPVNSIKLGNSLPELLTELHENLQETEFTPGLLDLIENCYAPEHTFSESFGLLLSHLVSAYGIIIADPSDPALKNLAAPVFHEEIDHPLTSSPAFKDHQNRIISAKYHQQVRILEDKLSLYLKDEDVKYRITKAEDMYTLEDPAEVLGKEDLQAVVEAEPERFIPSVLLRPLVQDYIFPTIAYVAGPGEIAYLSQLLPAYKQFEIPMPVIIPRAGITMVGGANKRNISKYNIEANEIFQPADTLIRHILEEHVPSQAHHLFKWMREEIQNSLRRLQKELDTGSGTFSRDVKTTAEKLDYHVSRLQGRYLKELERQNEAVVRRIENLLLSLFPDEKPQERVYSIVDFINLHGFDVIKRIHDCIDPLEPVHMLLDV